MPRSKSRFGIAAVPFAAEDLSDVPSAALLEYILKLPELLNGKTKP
jgi:hypothetical protein